MAAHDAQKCILLVDDDPDITNLITRWLERDGYRVRSSVNGHAAIAALSADPLPDLVLLDILLPKTSGLNVLRRLRAEERTRDLPVVMMTALASESDVKRGSLLGADDYIVKPLAERDFLERVRQALRKPRAQAPGF